MVFHLHKVKYECVDYGEDFRLLPVGPWAVTISPVRIRRPRRTSLPIRDKRSRITSLGPRPIRLVLRSHVPRPWVHCQQPMCVRPHAVGICVSTRRRAHVSALLPVRGVNRESMALIPL